MRSFLNQEPVLYTLIDLDGNFRNNIGFSVTSFHGVPLSMAYPLEV